MERQTSQKEFILTYLKNTFSHPTAEEIFQKVRQDLPHISLGTVYRNLDNFAKKGLIKEIPGEKKHYDAQLRPHHHFICKKCHQIFDIKKTELNLINLEKKTRKIGLLKDYEIFVYGICKKCK